MFNVGSGFSLQMLLGQPASRQKHDHHQLPDQYRQGQSQEGRKEMQGMRKGNSSMCKIHSFKREEAVPRKI